MSYNFNVQIEIEVFLYFKVSYKCCMAFMYKIMYSCNGIKRDLKIKMQFRLFYSLGLVNLCRLQYPIKQRFMWAINPT